MPLKEGYSDKTIGKNIAKLMREGRPKKQAIEIVMSKSGKSKKENQINAIKRKMK